MFFKLALFDEFDACLVRIVPLCYLVSTSGFACLEFPLFSLIVLLLV